MTISKKVKKQHANTPQIKKAGNVTYKELMEIISSFEKELEKTPSSEVHDEYKRVF